MKLEVVTAYDAVVYSKEFKKKKAFASLDCCLKKQEASWFVFRQHLNRVPHKTFRGASNIFYVWLPLKAASRPNFFLTSGTFVLTSVWKVGERRAGCGERWKSGLMTAVSEDKNTWNLWREDEWLSRKLAGEKGHLVTYSSLGGSTKLSRR